MEFSLLRTFLLLAEERSVTRVAQRLNRTQPAISLQLSRLERLAGCRIFESDLRKPKLTVNGEVLLLYARKLLDLHDEAISRFEPNELSGSVVLGCPDLYAAFLLTRILGRFQAAHPAVEVSVRCMLSRQVAQAMESDDIDVALASTVEQALQAWSNATGLTFEEVADSNASNIRIGFGDLGTATDGVLGYTDLMEYGGVAQSAIIRLEGPSLTALTSGNGGEATYAGTDATLYQVALHEIGRALGFADNADPNSVMYAVASSSNQTLDATDLTGAQLLYGPLAGAGATSEALMSSTASGGIAASTSASPLAAAGIVNINAVDPTSDAISSPVAPAAASSGVGTASGTDLASAQIGSLAANSAVVTATTPTVAASATATGASGLNQMIQAMATFAPQQTSASLTFLVAQNAALAQQLAAPLHA